MMTRPTIPQIIKKYNLNALAVEGGLFKQTYLSDKFYPKESLPDRFDAAHPYGTAILYLLTADLDSFSAMHKLKTTEIYHFYLGDPVEMLLLYPNGEIQIIQLGQDILSDQHIQFVVPEGVWQGSRLIQGGEYALLGTTMAPGYLDEDVEFGSYNILKSIFPTADKFIRQLTRI